MGSIRGVILRHRLLATGMAVVLAMLVGSLLGTLFWFRMTSGGGSGLTPAVSAGAGQGKISVDEARSLSDFDVFWVGDQFQGNGVSEIFRFKKERDPTLPIPVGEDYVLLIYGSCELPAGPEPSCAPPLAIRVESVCIRPSSLIADRVKEGPSFELRGATAQWVSGHLRIWTRGVSVTVFAPTDEVALEAASALVSLNSAAVQSPSDALGPPAQSAACAAS